MSRNDQISEHLPDYHVWLTATARHLAPHSNALHDDLVQEGYIAMWRAVDTHPGDGPLSAWLRGCARTRMRAVALDQHRMTGAEPMTEGYSFAKRSGDETRARIRAYITEWRRDHGTEPSQGQIARGLGMNSGNVNRHLKRMHLHHGQEARAVVSLDELLDGARSESGSTVDMDAVLLGDAVIEDVTLAYHYGEIHAAIADLDESWREYVWLRFWCGLTAEEIRAKGAGGSPWMWTHTIRPLLAERLSHLIDAS